jgi:hypothetical protein
MMAKLDVNDFALNIATTWQGGQLTCFDVMNVRYLIRCEVEDANAIWMGASLIYQEVTLMETRIEL